MGIYSGVMFVQQIPSTLPKICAAIRFRESSYVSGKTVLRLFYETSEGDSLLGEMTLDVAEEFKMPPSEEFLMREMVCVMQVAPFEITEEGRLKVRAYKDDNEMRLGALVISRPPAEENADPQEV
jgi:hypothetical protein